MGRLFLLSAGMGRGLSLYVRHLEIVVVLLNLHGFLFSQLCRQQDVDLEAGFRHRADNQAGEPRQKTSFQGEIL